MNLLRNWGWGGDEAAFQRRFNRMLDNSGMEGIVVIEHISGWGDVLSKQLRKNLITDSGDLYNAQQVITGVSPASASAPTRVTGMKLGTGTTAPSKNGAGAALVTYTIANGQNLVFDATYPQYSNLGASNGVTAVYKCTFNAGSATASALTEAVIVNDASTDATSTAGNTISRVTFGAVNKGASDVLSVTWSHKFLGA